MKWKGLYAGTTLIARVRPQVFHSLAAAKLKGGSVDLFLDMADKAYRGGLEIRSPSSRPRQTGRRCRASRSESRGESITRCANGAYRLLRYFRVLVIHSGTSSLGPI
jgi:hypothetical protein